MIFSDLLPFLIPLAVVQFLLLFILTHKNYKRGSRALWLVITIIGMEFIGPVLYLLLGREDS